MDQKPSGWIGAILQDKWRIEAKIARGGVATVFRAAHTRGGQPAAIKIMHPELTRNADVRRRFLREGYTANKVNHPNVVHIIDDDVTPDGSAFIVMELLEDAEELEVRREKAGGRLPIIEVAQICDQVLDVLASAHEKGIIHRDIKPENIMILKDGTVKVLDFGIAHIREAAIEHEPTATGLLLGTPEYMSPEQVLGKRGVIDAKSDIYSVGAMMFTLLSGQAVHVHDILNVLLVAVTTRQARSLAAATKDVPPDVIAVVDKALMLEKHRRWSSAREMQAALRKAVPQASERKAVAAARAQSNPKLPPPTTPRSGVKIPRAPIPLPSRASAPPAPTPAPAPALRVTPPSHPPPSGGAAHLSRLGPIAAPAPAPPPPAFSADSAEIGPPSSGATIVTPTDAPSVTLLKVAAVAPGNGQQQPQQQQHDVDLDDAATTALPGAPVRPSSDTEATARLPSMKHAAKPRVAPTDNDDGGEDAATIDLRALRVPVTPLPFAPSPPQQQPQQQQRQPQAPAPPFAPWMPPAPNQESEQGPSVLVLAILAAVLFVVLMFGGCLLLRG